LFVFCSVNHAKAFAALTGLGGVALLALGTNELTAVLGAFNLALYTCAYTPLKRTTLGSVLLVSFIIILWQKINKMCKLFLI
jgi:protoheme IX farnesyltransferase